MSSDSNKRIAKNTLMLYFRMLIIMGVGLYTSRIVLNTLGVEDFGIYNVVGGIVTMLGFLNSAMSSGTQRFLSFELGRKNYAELSRVFSMSINIHATIALVILILAETAGLWFLNTQLTIPAERMAAANWVYQFSILTFMVSVMSVPYNALIIAHERMNVYAYVSIVEVILKLVIVFMLQWFGFDKLKLYAILVFTVSVLIRLIYGLYSRRHFTESKYQLFWDKSLFKTLIGYAGWNLFGHFSWAMMGQGLNLLLNIFFGPVVNASRGIAFQINGVLMGFINNFRTAANPQIIKSYSIGDFEYMNQLVFNSAKYSYYLLFFLTLPVFLETKFILHLWLKIIPEYSIIFCQLVLINTLVQSFDASFGIVFHAMGRIKENQVMSGGLYLLILPISYILLKLNHPPQIVFYVQIFFTIMVAFGVKLYLMKKLAGMSTRNYLNLLVFPVFKVTLISIILPILLRIYISEGYVRIFAVFFSSVISTSIVVFYIGMNKYTRLKIMEIIKNKLSTLWKE